MNVFWSETAKATYAEELDFIYRKWGTKEVEKFINLSITFIKTLKTGVLVGKPIKKKEFRISKISKQTSLVYSIDKKNNLVTLITFFNNKMNPKTLKKLLSINI
jgi:plasmid stabilization system protein ParE